MKAQLPLKGTVAASDAFFPFPDGVEEIAKAGATAIIQPGGSVRDQEVIEAADRLGLAMIFTGVSGISETLNSVAAKSVQHNDKLFYHTSRSALQSPCTSGFQRSLRFLAAKRPRKGRIRKRRPNGVWTASKRM